MQAVRPGRSAFDPLALSMKMRLSEMPACFLEVEFLAGGRDPEIADLSSFHLLLWIELLIDISRCMQHPDNFYPVRDEEVKYDIATNRKTVQARQKLIARSADMG
jgi:hypothetical protein